MHCICNIEQTSKLLFRIQAFVLFLFLTFSSLAQTTNRQGANWYFGSRIGVKFNTNGTISTYTNGATTYPNNLEGTATISDSAGNLLFYTDGQSIWNKNHVLMTNGTGLMGSYSSTQSGVIVPHPTNKDLFYVFTVDDCQHNLANGLRYSIVDMTLSGGLGAVTATKNVLLSPSGVQMAEKITGVRHCNNRDIWVIGHGYGLTNGQKFYAWLITPTGINSPVISTVGTVHYGAREGSYNGVGNARGYMKVSPGGDKIALAICYDGAGATTTPTAATTGSFEVFDFNYTTGVVSNPIKFYGTAYKGAYGVEFSPNGKRLYGSTWGYYNSPLTVIQWNLDAGSATAVQNSAVTIQTKSGTYYPCALQLAPNGKIYCAIEHFVSNSAQYLDVINYPNKIGTSCGYQANALYLGMSGSGPTYGPLCGLPTFIQSYFDPKLGFDYVDNYEDMITKFFIADSLRIDSVLWNFGDPASGAANISRSYSPVHPYSDTGTYNITLILYKCLIQDTIKRTIIIYPRPNTAFTINNDTQCSKDNQVVFTNTTTIESGSIAYYKWYFGDGDTSNQTHPTHHYTKKGQFTVKLVATSIYGGKDSTTRVLRILYSPVSYFEVDDSDQCFKGNSFIFDNNSTIATGGSMTYKWFFGNGDSTTTAYPSAYSYTSPGIYTVRLIARSDSNCYDTFSINAYVRPMPVANFSINDSDQCFKTNSFILTNTTTLPYGYNSWLWKFGDNTSDTSKNKTKSYSSTGTFQVFLRAISNYGCRDSITQTVSVYPNPVAAFAMNDSTQCLRGNSFSFSNSSSINPSNIALSYLWSFDDGTTSLATSPTKVFNNYNTYNVKLKVTSAVNACTDSVTKKAYVYPMPVSSFAVSDTSECLTGNSFAFTNTSSIPSGTMTHLWKFGDASTSSLANPNKSYSNTGTFTVQLIETSNEGCTDTSSREVYVRPMPSVNFLLNTIFDSAQCLKQNNFTAWNYSTISSGTLSYEWNMGDGTIYTTENISHKYSYTNTFTITLKATSDYGCVNSKQKNAYVYPNPVAAFSINDTDQCRKNNSFLFTRSSSISSGATNGYWYFGDLSSSSVQNPTHTYLNDGTFNVLLIETSNKGCLDSAIRTVLVYPSPNFSVTLNDSTQCFNGHNFVFQNNSSLTYGTQSFLWDFGDGDTSTSRHVTHQYNVEDTFQVKLKAVTDLSCSDSIYFKLYLFPNPVADFSIDDSVQCKAGNLFSFTNQSSISWGSFNNNWDFNDGIFSSSSSPTHSFAYDDTFHVELITTSNFGCSDSLTKNLYVFPTPVVSFIVNDSAQCFEGNSFNFMNLSTINSGSMSWNWSFGNGDTSTAHSPGLIYSTDDTFTVKLVATSDLLCQDSFSKKVYIFPNPVADFSINDSVQCFKANNFSFTNLTTINSGSKSFQWLFGDGSSSTQNNPSRTYLYDDTFTVKLIATSGLGCKDSITRKTYVFPTPNVSFSVNDSTQCFNGNHFNFTNLSTINSGTMAWNWSFGNGDTSTTHSPGIIYSTDDTFSVKLVATSDLLCKDSANKNVYVFPNPLANFSIDDSTQCFNEYKFSFNNLALSAVSTHSGGGSTALGYGPGLYNDNNIPACSVGGTNMWGWVTTNGWIEFSWSTAQTFDKVVFYKANRPMSTCTFEYWDGSAYHSFYNYNNSINVCEDSVSFPIVTTTRLRFNNIAGAPNPNFREIQVFRHTGNKFYFTNLSTINTGTQSFLWFFGDGSSSTQSNPSRSYLIDDTFSVKLIATSGLGCKDSITHQAYVFPTPIVSFAVNDSSQCFNGNHFNFSNLSTINSGTMDWNWNFGNGDTSTAHSPGLTYSTDDTFTVKLIAISDLLCKDSVSKKVYIFPNPVAAFSINDTAQCFKGNNFSFTNLSTINSGTQTFQWVFGDGSGSTQTNPSRSYLYDDTFTVKLVATSALGCKDSISRHSYVFPTPNVSFSVNDSTQCFNGNHFNFTNLSTINSGTMAWNWSFGNGDTSTAHSPGLIYSTDDTFTVKLVATSDLLCQDSLSKKVYIFPNPVADFSVNDSTQCFKENNFAFTNLTTIHTGTQSFLWFFGDGSSSVLINPSRTYLYDDTFTVKLVATSALGCKDSISRHSYVFPNPVSAFSVNDTSQCLASNSFIFSSQTAINSGNFNHLWTFGDGISSNLTNAAHSYMVHDTFTVKLVNTSDLGCKDSTSRKVYIRPMPSAVFSVDDSTQCLSGNLFSFTNTSSIPYGSFSNSWNFGDGQFSASGNPSHSYSSHDTFTVKLVLTSTFGCQDSMMKNVQVYPMPTASFDFNDSNQCFRDNHFLITNTSTIAWGLMNYFWNFGDTSQSTLINPSHSYGSPDTFTISLLALSSFGCRDSISHKTYVFPMPDADFEVNDTSQCMQGNYFEFTNKSSISSGTFTSDWFFMDGDTSFSADASHSYIYHGYFPVKLIVTSALGCKDTAIIPVSVHYDPTADFAVNQETQCFRGHQYIFTNNSSLTSGTLYYTWDLGDGTQDTATDITHIYSTDDTFRVSLKTVTESGCVDSIVKYMYVRPTPKAKYALYDTSQCFDGNAFGFTNLSTINSGNMFFEWSFGDGDSSNLVNPVHTYPYADTFDIKLLVVSAYGCSDSVQGLAYVHVHPEPVAAFMIDTLRLCLRNNLFNFTNLSGISSGTFTSHWDFGDMNTFNGFDTSHSYAYHDTFPVKLLVISDWGCKDSIIKPVQVFPMPKADFQIADTAQCFYGNKFYFADMTSIDWGSYSFILDFGDGSTSVQYFDSHSYLNFDTFQLTLTATSAYGCTDSISKFVIVHSEPVPGFYINQDVQCFSGNLFSFSDTSTENSGHALFYSWDFGDGSSSSTQNPTHSYSYASDFVIKQTVTNAPGCKDSFSQSIRVNPAPYDLLENADTNSISKGLVAYYPFEGNANDQSGNGLHASVYGAAPTTGAVGNAYSFDGIDDYIEKSYDPAFTPDNQSWTISSWFKINGYGSTGRMLLFWYRCGANPLCGSNDGAEYAFYQAPDNKLKFYIRDDAMGTGSAVTLSTPNTISVNEWHLATGILDTQKDSMYFYFDNCLVDQTYYPSSALTAGSIQVPFEIGRTYKTGWGSPENYFYGSIDEVRVYKRAISRREVNDLYQQAKHLNIQVQNPQVCLNTSARIYLVNPQDGIKYQLIDTSGMKNVGIPQSRNCNDTLIFLTGLINDTVWFRFSATDTTTGCSILLDTLIKIYNYPQPVPAFSINSNPQCLTGNNFILNNNSTISSGTLSYIWDFNDGFHTNLLNPSHSYLTEDTFNIKLIATSAFGCKDSIVHPVFVHSSPKAGFDIDDSQMCFSSNAFHFTNTSTIRFGTMDYFWDFGDASTGTSSNPNKIYSSDDTFAVKLVVTSNLGCRDSINKNVYVFPSPVADFSISDSFQCLNGNNFDFTNLSTIHSGSFSSQWNFGDGNISAANNPSHSYSNYNSFPVKLVIVSNQNCSDSIQKTVFVNPSPLASFSVNDSGQCLGGNHFIFSNSSSIGQGTYISLWSFGDGNNSVQDNPNHSYNLSNDYDVRLKVTSDKGCNDSTNVLIHVFPMPVSGFSVNDSSQCLSNNNFIFSNLSTISTGSLSHKWYFGDNSSSTITNPTHQYTADGKYPVKLITTSDEGCPDSTISIVSVHPMPKAAFDYSVPCLGDSVLFSDLSTMKSPDYLNKWDWNFGDGGTASSKNPYHVYWNYGTFPVNLKVISDKGCSDSVRRSLIIYRQIATPVAERATVENKKIVVEWQPITNGRLQNFFLERSPDSIWWSLIYTPSARELSFIDEVADASNSHYYYRLRAVDSCLYTTPYSNIAKTIHLKVDDKGASPVLTWTPYMHWDAGIDHYEVKIYDDELHRFTTLATLDQSVTSFTDQNSRLDQENYCYHISAYRKGDNLESRSNQVCITTPFQIWVPNAFTPNGDGLNDSFSIAARYLITYEISIFSRWGEEVFHSTNINESWDGRYKGKLCPEGYYEYMIIAKGTDFQRKNLRGKVLLLNK